MSFKPLFKSKKYYELGGGGGRASLFLEKGEYRS